MGLRIALMPVIAGVSYEMIRLAGNSENPVVNLLSRPGMWVQMMTTKRTRMNSTIEVAIRAVEEVFDWKAYLKDNVSAAGNFTEKQDAHRRDVLYDMERSVADGDTDSGKSRCGRISSDPGIY